MFFFNSNEPSEIEQNFMSNDCSKINFDFISFEQPQIDQFDVNLQNKSIEQDIIFYQDELQPPKICAFCNSEHPLNDQQTTHSCSYALYLRMLNLINNDPFYKIKGNVLKRNHALKKNENMLKELRNRENKLNVKGVEKKIKKYLFKIIEYEHNNIMYKSNCIVKNLKNKNTKICKLSVNKFICPKCKSQFQKRKYARRHMKKVCFASEEIMVQNPKLHSEIVEIKFEGK